MVYLKHLILVVLFSTVAVYANSQPDPPAGCVDVFLINPNMACPTDYMPVCGCDGVTYSNECVAYNYYGVTEWNEGECFSTDTFCFDLGGIDFGFCNLYLGIGIVNGECQGVSGCGYLIDGIDYSNYFYLSMEDCQSQCESQSGCINPSLIDSLAICSSIYAPVCGCDGVTYENECVAINGYGITFWTEGECGISFSPPCSDLSNIDFGDCEMVLGIGIINGECLAISGCGYLVDGTDYSASFFDSYEACTTQCLTDTLCFDFLDLDFGVCEMLLGVGMIDGSCQYISGCSTYLDGVDYSSFFWDNIEDCMYYCESTDCYDQSVIDLDYSCTEEYAPVCGCDGITYSNACVAYYYHGITDWSEGSCPSNDTLCFDLGGIDFGDCEMVLGVGIINGECQFVSGCSYLVNNIDYSVYFYDSMPSCQEYCQSTDGVSNFKSTYYSIYPNPSNHGFNIIFETSKLRNILLKNNLEKTVLQKSSHDKTVSINTDNFSKGMYYLIITQDNLPNKVSKVVLE